MVISTRTGRSANSMLGGQGHVHCNGLGACDTERCKCSQQKESTYHAIFDDQQ